MNVKIYVEGGGDTRALRTLCRRGFSEFFAKVGLRGRMPRIVASGGRRQAFDDGLKAATRRCDKKGNYDKGPHSFEILARIDPVRVRNASPHAERLVKTLLEKAEA